METQQTSLVIKNFIFGFLFYCFGLVIFLLILWSIIYGQLTALILLYTFFSSFTWLLSYSIFFFLVFPMIFMKVELSINSMVGFSTIITSILIFTMLSNTNGISSQQSVYYPTMQNDEEISKETNHILVYSVPITHGIMTYLSYLARKKNWCIMYLS